MCAIVDANVAPLLFRADDSGAAAAFFEWINTGTGRLVVGGKLRTELAEVRSFVKWQREATLAGLIRSVSDKHVNSRADVVKNEGLCRSNDEHIIALAQISGARLLYSHDKNLHKDFRNRALLADPRGKVYSTLTGPELRHSHRQLLDGCTCRGKHNP